MFPSSQLLSLILLFIICRTSHSSWLCEDFKEKSTSNIYLKESDVTIRSLVPHPYDQKDPYNTLRVIEDFYATRLEWIYGYQPEFSDVVNHLGVSISGTCNAEPSVDNPNFYVKDIHGSVVIPPWERGWINPKPFGCVNNPKFQEAYIIQLSQLLSRPMQDLQRDEPGGNYDSVSWGGCYCDDCMRKFSEWLNAKYTIEELVMMGADRNGTLDYKKLLLTTSLQVPDPVLQSLFKEFQRESTIKFNQQWMEFIKKTRGANFRISCNNNAEKYEGIEGAFDFYIGELPEGKDLPEKIHEIGMRVQKTGKRQILTMPIPRYGRTNNFTVSTNRLAIALCYANGILMEVPWDEFMPSKSGSRYFGRLEEYADLFGFIRGISSYLDGYKEANSNINQKHHPGNGLIAPIRFLSDDPRAMVFVRIIPGCKNAPVVIHVISPKNNSNASVSIDLSEIFDGNPIKVSMLTPVPYDANLFESIKTSKKYSTLVSRKTLEFGNNNVIALKNLPLWSVLVLEPLPIHDASIPRHPHVIISTSIHNHPIRHVIPVNNKSEYL